MKKARRVAAGIVVLCVLASSAFPQAAFADVSTLRRLSEGSPRPLTLAQARRLAPQVARALDDDTIAALRGCDTPECELARRLVAELVRVAHRHRARDLRDLIEEHLAPVGEGPAAVVAHFAFAFGHLAGPVVATMGSRSDATPDGTRRRPPATGRYWRIEPFDEEAGEVTVRLYRDLQGSQRTTYRMDFRFGRWWVSAVRSVWLRGHGMDSQRGDAWARWPLGSHERCRLRSWDH